MTRVALFGGSFNPPHTGHDAILRWLVMGSPVRFDAIWVLPAVAHAFDKNLLPYDLRAEMVQALTEGWPHVRVVRREEKYTSDMLEALHREHPDTQFTLVLGADILNECHKWHRWDDVCRLAPPLFVSRLGVSAPTGHTIHQVWAPEVSSTEIRDRLARGERVGEDDLPLLVQVVIERHRLYCPPG